MNQTTRLAQTTPEAQGISSAAISAFVAADSELDTLHSFMLLRHGYVVAQGWWSPYQAHEPHMLFSLSKSFTATAIGLLVAEGRLTVDDPALDFFANEAPPEPSENLKAMRVRHLLAMSTGHETEPQIERGVFSGEIWARIFLAHPVEHAPGTHFLYNSIATYMLSAIVQKLSGGRMIDYLQQRLFVPLGIADPTWEQSPQGIDTGGWGLSITTADIAAFGQLYLQQGRWQGEQIVPAAWVAEASAKHTDNGDDPASDWAQGYGYQFWRCRHNAYRGDGAFGQYCVVLPEHDVVLAITSGLGDMQQVLNVVWKHLLPAFASAPLAEDGAAQVALGAQLAGLQLRTVAGQPASAGADVVSGKIFRMDDNAAGLASLQFDFGGEETLVTLDGEMGAQSIVVGYDRWLRGTATMRPPNLGPFSGNAVDGVWQVAASGAWRDEQTYTVKLWWVTTPFALTLHCRFLDDEISIAPHLNASFGPTELPVITGRAVVRVQS